ncbi:MAG: pyruvate kinase [Thermoleophilia bacterium]
MKTTSLRRTKIVATLGPASSTLKTTCDLLSAGVDCFRVNFSHGTPEEHEETFMRIREAESACGRPVAILADLQGPKLRLGDLPEAIVLDRNQDVRIAGAGDLRGEGLELGFEIDLGASLEPDSRVLIDDGRIRLNAIRRDGRSWICRVETGGVVLKRKGVNLPDANLPFPAITDHDQRCLEVACGAGADLIALSFVRRADDVSDLRRRLTVLSSRSRVIAKIEKADAVANLEAIVDAADGVMVARGDLGAEIGLTRVPLLQKRIIRLARARGRTTITATQMLDSMVERSEPTRAEASDVANAILDGSGALMLSAETAVGHNPVNAVHAMHEIAHAVERELGSEDFSVPALPDIGSTVADAIEQAAVELAESVSSVAILAPTETGNTPRGVSKHRPTCPIIAATSDATVLRQLAIEWAVIPLALEQQGSFEDLIQQSLSTAKMRGLVRADDHVVITAGRVMNRAGGTNMLLVHDV